MSIVLFTLLSSSVEKNLTLLINSLSNMMCKNKNGSGLCLIFALYAFITVEHGVLKCKGEFLC